MKTTTRSIPNDIFSVEEKGRFIRITTSLQRIHVEVGHNGHVGDCQEYTFEEFYDALQAVLTHYPPSPPSEADKEAATPAQEGKNSHS